MKLLILNDTELHPTKISNYDFHHSNCHVTSTDLPSIKVPLLHRDPYKGTDPAAFLCRNILVSQFTLITHSYCINVYIRLLFCMIS